LCELQMRAIHTDVSHFQAQVGGDLPLHGEIPIPGMNCQSQD
jgi:hypothetical protein